MDLVRKYVEGVRYKS